MTFHCWTDTDDELDSIRFEVIYRQRSGDISSDSISSTYTWFVHSFDLSWKTLIFDWHWHWFDWEGWETTSFQVLLIYHSRVSVRLLLLSFPLAVYYFIRSLYLVPFHMHASDSIVYHIWYRYQAWSGVVW